MGINFAMWRKAIWQLIKLDDKQQWDALDVISKWLIATRSAVTLVTVYSCIIAGLLAWRDGHFSWIPWIVLTIGLFIAHGTNNLLNDYTDYSRGVDKDNYFRTQYGVHPLVQGFWTKRQQLTWFVVSGLLATLAGFYALIYTHFNPITIGMFAFGTLVLLAYTYPFKYWGLGELAIFLIWGPILIGTVYFVLSGIWNWNVVLAGVPYGLGVASINIGKHIDKRDDDEKKGVGTFPVRVGERAARFVDQVALLLIYAVILYLVFVPRILHACHADRILCVQVRAKLDQGSQQASSCSPARRISGVAHLVLCHDFFPQPTVRRPAHSWADCRCLAARLALYG